MPFNADIATALSMVPQLGTLSDSPATKPTATQGAVIHSRAYDRVRGALRKVRLADTVTASSLAEGLCQRAEMFLASAEAMLAKGSLGKEAMATYQQLKAEADEALRQIETGHLWMVTEGATAETASPSHFVRSQQRDDADPDFDFTPGTGDVSYARNDVWPQDGEDL